MYSRYTRRQFLRELTASFAMAGAFVSLTGCTVSTSRPTATSANSSTAQSAIVAPSLSAASATKTTNVDRPPLLFIHGNTSHSALWLPTVWRCESAGWRRDRLFALDFPYPTARDDDERPQSGRSGTEEQREQLAATVRDVLARTGAGKVVLIGSSRGGNAIRSFLKLGGGAPLVSHAILCGTPNHGAYVRAGDRNEFNGAGPFLQGLNEGSEVVPSVPFLTLRSDKYDLYAQPGDAGYDGPALAGATNIVLPGADHNETATSQRAFAAIAQFLTGRQIDGAITHEERVELNGRVTGFIGSDPTNVGVGGVTVAVYEVDPATGQRRGAALHAQTTTADGVWGPFTTRPATYHEFVVAAAGQPTRHFFRTPFPRASQYVGLRLWPDTARSESASIVFTRPRGYVATGRDSHSLDGRPVPGVPVGLPTAGSFRITFPGPERGVPAALNGETMTVRAIPGAITYAEFHF